METRFPKRKLANPDYGDLKLWTVLWVCSRTAPLGIGQRLSDPCPSPAHYLHMRIRNEFHKSSAHPDSSADGPCNWGASPHSP